MAATREATITKGTLTFTAGTINVNNLFVGNQQFTAAANSNPMAGVLNVNGPTAILIVNTNLVLARTNTASTAALSSTGNLNIINGTVQANSITSWRRRRSHHRYNQWHAYRH